MTKPTKTEPSAAKSLIARTNAGRRAISLRRVAANLDPSSPKNRALRLLREAIDILEGRDR